MCLQMASKLSDDFLVTDSLRKWASSKNWPAFIPDVFISDFRMHHAAKGTRYDNWYQAFQNWINWSAPGGRFYHASEWESKLAAAKALESPPRKRIIPAYDPRGAQLDAGQIKTAYEIAQARLREVREKAGI